MKNAIERLDALGSRIMSTWRLVLLAAAEIELGDYQAAEATVSEASANVERTGERWCEPEVHRVAAEAILRQEGLDLRPAEERLRQAIEIARKQSAKWWELRATTRLARLLEKTGRREEARSMLAEIYDWFSEGFDTADLKGAKALLEELAG
jgi:predicted ATPase